MNAGKERILGTNMALLVAAACVLLSIAVSILVPVSTAGAAGTDAAEYYPLAVGNQWEFESQQVGEGRRERHTQTIAGRFELEDGAVLYTWDDGKSYLIQGKEGIISGAGMYELRSPIAQDSMWSTGEQTESRPLFRVARVGLPMTVQGISYAGCIEVVLTTGQQATYHVPPGKQEGRVEYLALEVHHYYAPGVGPILAEWYEKPQEGAGRLRHRVELVRFSPGAAASTPQVVPTPRQIEAASKALRQAKSVVAHLPQTASPQRGAAPYTEEAAAKIDAAAKKLFAAQPSQPAAPPEGSAAERLQRGVDLMREVYREAGYDYDATVARFLDDVMNRREIPPRSLAPMLVFQLGALLGECRSQRLDCFQFFSGEAAAAIRKLADLEPARK